MTAMGARGYRTCGELLTITTLKNFPGIPERFGRPGLRSKVAQRARFGFTFNSRCHLQCSSELGSIMLALR